MINDIQAYRLYIGKKNFNLYNIVLPIIYILLSFVFSRFFLRLFGGDVTLFIIALLIIGTEIPSGHLGIGAIYRHKLNELGLLASSSTKKSNFIRNAARGDFIMRLIRMVFTLSICLVISAENYYHSKQIYIMQIILCVTWVIFIKNILVYMPITNLEFSGAIFSYMIIQIPMMIIYEILANDEAGEFTSLINEVITVMCVAFLIITALSYIHLMKRCDKLYTDT